ncbi:DciA family protein [Isoptericola sp. NEAU-Y5]|uniref:DciA family protein n=1 Tax=Isoptericola luteus TaxID=2879484 RepID=A0ABS7ZI02_9MICO|nr:DciA family protein [Isoptericola sp. NEAU-Y5]MCA5894127.1 DciA family protein [Isoptericola sp. NEAU-Y5]
MPDDDLGVEGPERRGPGSTPDDGHDDGTDGTDGTGVPGGARRAAGDLRPVGDRTDLTPAVEVAREALNRAKAAARAKGLRPGSPARRSPLVEPRYSGKGPGARDPQLLSDVIGRLLRDKGWTSDVSVGGVIGRWREVVGDQVADHCEPETFEDKVLVVRADSTAWATQVRLLVPTLLRRLSEEVGEGVVEQVTVLGPAGPGFRKGRRSVRGPGPRDTYG